MDTSLVRANTYVCPVVYTGLNKFQFRWDFSHKFFWDIIYFTKKFLLSIFGDTLQDATSAQ